MSQTWCQHNARLSRYQGSQDSHLQCPCQTRNCNCYKYSFFVKIIREWNDLPANVVEIGNLRRFKIALKSYMRIS